MASPKSERDRLKLLAHKTSENRADMIRTLLPARAKIEARILRAARDKRYSTVRRVREGLLKDIGKMYVDLGGDLNEWAKRSTLNTSKDFHALLNQDLKLTGEDFQILSFAQFSQDHLDDYFERINAFNADRIAAVNAQMNVGLNRMLDSDVRELRNATIESFRLAEVSGMTSQERIRDLRERVEGVAENPTSWAFIDRTGRRWKNNSYFSMLNRTTTARVARETYNDGLIDEGRDLVQVIGGLSPNSHPACQRWNGKLLSLTGATPGYKTVSDAEAEGLHHPNCVHSEVYVSDKTASGRELIEDKSLAKPDDSVELPKKKPKAGVGKDTKAIVERAVEPVKFVPAKTVQEATRDLVNLGVRDVIFEDDVDTQVSLDAMNGMKKAIIEKRSSTVGRIVFQKPDGDLGQRGVVASHTGSYFDLSRDAHFDDGRITYSGSIEPSRKLVKKKFNELAFRVADQYDDFWEGVYVHEYGHHVEGVLDRSVQKRATSVLKRTIGNIEAETILANNVSMASGIDRHELAAEVWAKAKHPLFKANANEEQKKLFQELFGDLAQ